ncbi:MAG: glycosyltransferase family 4 protein [Chloroflexi bacterium]|nr:glycosyltransferase family 4 protein [Chloroflexota bacterium]
MKIALVSPYDYAYPGGVTSHVSQLANELRRTGNQVHIIAPCSSDEAPTDLPFHRLGTPVSLPANGSVARVAIGARLSRDVRETLASGAFDVVHLHEPLLPTLPLAVLRSSRTTNVGTFHTARRSALAYLSAKPFLEYFFRKLDGKIAVSESARDFVGEHFPGQYRVIPNGIDVEYFQRRRTPIARFQDGRLNVLFLGRLEKRKGLSHLLRAWGRVREAVPEARLVVAGGGRALNHYQKFVQARGSDDIVFTGPVSDEDKVRYYQTADIYCAPSTGGESFGIVLLEAMAAGTPIVATDIPGYREVVTHGKEGLLVPPRDAGQLAESLIRALRDPGARARLGEKGRETARRYDWQQVGSEVLDYYTETIHRRALLSRLRRPRFRRVRRVASGVAHLLTR